MLSIPLPLACFPGVGRNPKGDGKKKGGLKVHMMIDAHAETVKYATISEAKQHDKNFLKSLSLPIGSMIVFDKAYNHYFQFAKWTNQGVNFVCRLKDNAAYEVQEVLFERTLNGKEHGVTKEEHIHLKYKEGKKTKRTPFVSARWITLMRKVGNTNLSPIIGK